MKFPRNARIFRGQLDAAPFAIVFFLLVMFMMLGSLLYTPGVRIDLPVADDLPGLDKQHISVAVDKSGRFYFNSKDVGEAELIFELRKAVVQCAPQPLTLVVQADKAVSLETLLRLRLLARDAGIADATIATLPREMASPGPP